MSRFEQWFDEKVRQPVEWRPLLIDVLTCTPMFVLLATWKHLGSIAASVLIVAYTVPLLWIRKGLEKALEFVAVVVFLTPIIIGAYLVREWLTYP